MKLLMIYADKFGYNPTLKTIEDAEDVSGYREITKALVGFIHIEKEDENREGYIETKLVKNIKWAARKNNTNTIILHSFAHLSESKADSDFTKLVLDNVEGRLFGSGYEVSQTPFGYFLDLNLQAPGYPLARLFKSF